MSRSGRVIVIVGAVVLAVAAFVVLRPSDDDDGETGSSPPVETAPAAPGETQVAPPPKPKPRVDTIRVRNGKPVGGVKDLTWEKGDTIRLAVRSDAPHEVHIHGYDVSKHVEAGEVVRFRFDANLDGIYEIELEDLAEPIAELKVEP